MKTLNLNQQLKIIEQKLQTKIKNALQSEVAETSRQTMKNHLETDVYSQYTPTTYERKYSDGGLLDDNNIQTTMVNETTLKIENIRRDEKTGRLVAPIIEHGIGYWGGLDAIIGERPFVRETSKELANGKAKNSLKQGLVRQGLNVK